MAVRGAGRSGGVDVRTQSIATLRTITLRLSSTSGKQLAQLAAGIADSIWSCRDLLSASQDALKANSDVAALVHRYKTHLSTLLQDRTVEARWAAVVLVKATVEAGGLETLSKSNAWVRNLLAILKKHDPPTSRTLAVLALTRIFMLTWDHTNLIREITTPALPAFVSTCLNNAASSRCSARELQAILESFSTLLARHPTIFRSNETQIRALLVKMISSKSASTDARKHFTSDHQVVASRLWVQLHHCGPKQTSTDVWEANFAAMIRAAHATCDRVFRCIIERWETVAGIQPSAPSHTISSGGCTVETDDILGLNGWDGVDQGMQRLISLINLLSTSFRSQTAAQVQVKIGLLLDLISRLLAIRQHEPASFNPQIPKDERDAMFAQLPALHKCTLELVWNVISRYTSSATSVIQPVLTEISALALTQSLDSQVRCAVFEVVQQIVDLVGPSMTKADISDIESVIRACCESIHPAEQTSAEPVDLAIPTTKSSSRPFDETKEAKQAAWRLLPALIANLRPSNLSTRARTRMERTAILAQHKTALIACVLNPVIGGPRTQASLLPILARQYPSCPEVEAIIRPRMPVILSHSVEDQDDEGEEPAEESYDEPAARFPNDAETGDEPKTVVRLLDETPGERNTILDKRTMSLADEIERPTKRSRPSPAAQAVLPEPTVALPEDSVEPMPLQTVAVEASVSREGHTARPVANSVAGAPAPVTTGDEDDDSDFEMPPLTMDPDTDAEDD